MTVSGSQQPLDGSGFPGEDDRAFEQIEAAVAETERGRRFLAAYARRHRGADTDVLLQAIARLEATVTRDAARRDAVAGEPLKESRAAPGRDDLSELAGLVEAARQEIEAGLGRSGAAETFEAMIQSAGGQTSAILAATEAMQEAAWTLREKAAEEQLCDVLDRRASAIDAACAELDRITQLSLGIARTLSLLETRIAAMIKERGGTSGDADRDLRVPFPFPSEPEAEHRETAARPAAEPKETDRDDLASAFADLDQLSIEEKIALFS